MPSENDLCPICGKLNKQEFKPFCSARCGDIDLNRWLSGQYSIPAEELALQEKPGNDNEKGDDPSI